MRRNARHNAILNSPVVRALIKPVKVTPLAAPPPPPCAPPTPSELIPTQPLPSAPSAPASAPSIPQAVTTSTSSPEEIPVGGTKRKRGDGDEGDEQRKAVITNYTEDNLPQELEKYWAQRYRLFSKFDDGCQMDLEGWYSVTPELIAVQIAERCRSGVVLDAFCGVGGNAIQFAFTCERVIAIDSCPTRLACAAHNAAVYGVADRITFIHGDFVEYARDYAQKKQAGTLKPEEEIEVVFLSPPWGGIDYREAGASPAKGHKVDVVALATALALEADPNAEDAILKPETKLPYPLSALAPLHGAKLFALARAISPHVAYYLPRNTDVEEVARLPTLSPRSDRPGETDEVEKVEIEEEWTRGKLKAVTVYYGDLAIGSEH